MTEKRIKTVCKKCDKEFMADASWDYPLCKDCSMKAYETAENFWFTEVLGYSEALSDFLPSLPNSLFQASLKGLLTGDPRFDVADDPHMDRKVKADMKMTGEAQRLKLVKKMPEKTVKCTKCDAPYTVDGVWSYNICSRCAIGELMDWRKYWMSKVPGINASQIPPMDVKKFSVEGKK
jgi:hypothetical protein